MLLAKKSLMDDIDMAELKRAVPQNATEALRIELCDKVNALGIGAQGLGGLTTVLDVKIAMAPTHAAGKPVAMIPNCAATRHAHFVLDGSGPPTSTRRASTSGPTCSGRPTSSRRRSNLDTLTREEVASWKPGDGCCSAARCSPAATPRTSGSQDMLAEGRAAAGRFHGPRHLLRRPGRSGARRGRRPGRPDDATRMDKFTEMMLAKTGLIAMIGKAERGPVAIEAIRKHKSAYLMAVGGAAYLVSKAIKAAKVVAFEDLGMEAIYEFAVQDMPVTVAVDAKATSVHETGPAEWKARIGRIPVAVAT